ncbi:MAG: leucyl/phenylalanyl-tRNA--protein transferase [candidate division KSB1 bacterium]
MIPANTLLEAYSQGIFPMADEDGAIGWYEANPRAIIEIDGYRIPHDLKRVLKRNSFELHRNRSFEQVMRNCMQRNPTWISEEMVRSYVQLHRLGHAHSVETWHNGELVGGLYGVHIGGAFFGESMFHRASHASKIALAHLMRHLQERNFALHDAQMMTSTLKLFGAENIPRSEYLQRLEQAIKKKVVF